VQWLTILPEDDEKTRTKKKKLIKSYKSKMRFAKLDQETKVGERDIDLSQRWHGLKRGGCGVSEMYEPMHPEVCKSACSQDRQSSWQNFQKGKVTKKKKPAGFMTGAWC
jgi:histidinol phosphatase-like enzyme